MQQYAATLDFGRGIANGSECHSVGNTERTLIFESNPIRRYQTPKERVAGWDGL